MNTSYNYADFIGSDLNDNNQHDACVETTASQKGKGSQPVENSKPLKNEFHQDKPIE